MTESERLAALEREGVRIVRVSYPDLHGVLRGKDVPIGAFAIARFAGRPRLLQGDLDRRPAAQRRRRVRAWLSRHPREPLPETLGALPWAPEVAWCLADQTADGEPYGADPRATLKRAMAALRGARPASP